MGRLNNKWSVDIQQIENDIWFSEDYVDTREEAIAKGYELAKEHNLDFFRIGLCREVWDSGIDVEILIEDIQSAMYDMVGEVAEDYLDSVTGEQLEELQDSLNEVYFAWLKKHNHNCDYYTIFDDELIKVDKV